MRLLWVYLRQALCKCSWKINPEPIRAGMKWSVMYRSEATLNNLPVWTSTMQRQACFGACCGGKEGKERACFFLLSLCLYSFAEFLLLWCWGKQWEEQRKEVAHHYVTLKQERFISLIMNPVIALSLTECVGLRRLRRRKASIMFCKFFL